MKTTEGLKDTLWRSTIVNELVYERGYTLSEAALIVGSTEQHCRTLLNPPPVRESWDALDHRPSGRDN
jgi:hypothetical protein